MLSDQATPCRAQRSPVLQIQHAHLEAIREHIQRGARSVAAGVGTDVSGVGICLLADFPVGPAPCDGDLCAGVMMRLDGTLSGTALLSMDPEHALAWISARPNGPGAEPLAAYLELGRTLLATCLGALADGFGCTTEPGTARLEEETVVGIVLATHAPSDTVVLSARLEVPIAGQRLPAHVTVLLEPKLLESLLS
ncbi:MAG: hypothetical protein O7G30_08415 [Proteobacteria bacterium]|nr:hypothetical protein [Pseudomonadota bacterium]